MLDLALLRRIGWPILLVGGILLVAAAAPLLAPQDPIRMDVVNRLGPPSWDHLLGQDEYGRDVLSRLIHGARVSLSVALLSAAIAAVIGVVAGLVGGYFGGLSEILTLRVVDIVLCFPPLLLALLIVTVLGPGVETLTLVLSVLFIPGFARVAYGEVLSTKNQEYVEATRALGARAPRILFNAILPNIIGPILVQFSLTVAAAIILESGLSFLGLGVVPPAPSWGLMIRGARGFMEQNPMGLLWPCMALVFTIWSINRLCDSLRDAIDPRTASTSRRFWRRLREAVLPSARGATPSAMPGNAVLSVENLRTSIVTPNAIVRAVDDVSFTVGRGETVAVVGESGSGKSMTGLSVMGLLPKPGGRIIGGAVRLATKGGPVVDLAALDEEALQKIRGEQVAMIFQEPMTSLNPVHRIGTQITEAILAHRAVDKATARKTAHALLERVGIPDPARCLDEYPHQLSGGMRQRAMIALALSCEPVLLIADEPTTALDVTIQAQILDLMRQLQRERPSATAHAMAVIFITHNLGIVAEMADRVIVMYAGQIAEQGPVADIFARPHHPYTRGLLESVPRPERGEAAEAPARRRLATIPGTVPNLAAARHGCAFAPRCPLAIDPCRNTDPPLVDVAADRASRCLRWSEV